MAPSAPLGESFSSSYDGCEGPQPSKPKTVKQNWTFRSLQNAIQRSDIVGQRPACCKVRTIEHIESTTYNGSAVIKIFLQPHTSLDRANSRWSLRLNLFSDFCHRV
jgi:hypothetical protein